MKNYQMVPHPTPLEPPASMLMLKTLMLKMTLHTLKSLFPLLLRSPVASANPWQTLSETISEITTTEWGNCLKIVSIHAKAKTNHSIKKERIKHKMNMEMECTLLEHHQQEANAQHAHEAAMFDHQIALETMKAGGPMSNIHPNFC